MHDRMLKVLHWEFRQRSGATVGVTALFRRMESGGDSVGVLTREFEDRWGSPEGAGKLAGRVHAARARALAGRAKGQRSPA